MLIYRSLSLLLHGFFVAIVFVSPVAIFCLWLAFLSKFLSVGFILFMVQLETPEFEKISTQEERKAFVEKLDEA